MALEHESTETAGAHPADRLTGPAAAQKARSILDTSHLYAHPATGCSMSTSRATNDRLFGQGRFDLFSEASNYSSDRIEAAVGPRMLKPIVNATLLPRLNFPQSSSATRVLCTKIFSEKSGQRTNMYASSIVTTSPRYTRFRPDWSLITPLTRCVAPTECSRFAMPENSSLPPEFFPPRMPRGHTRIARRSSGRQR